MLTSIIASVMSIKWHLALFGMLLAWFYLFAKDKGYNECQEKAQQAQNEAKRLEESRSSAALKVVMQAQKEKDNRNEKIQNDLRVIINKYNNRTACNLTADELRSINSVAR